VAVLCGTWLGFFTIYVIDGWCTLCGVPRRLYAFFFWLGYVNSAVNPILYTVFKADFREAFHRLLCRHRRRRPPTGVELEGRQRRRRGYSEPALQPWRPGVTWQPRY